VNSAQSDRLLGPTGFLAPGIHDMSLEEVGKRFGSFSSTDRRPTLFKKLQQFVEQARQARFVRFLIVNGSFISSKADPGDVDIIVVIDPAALDSAHSDEKSHLFRNKRPRYHSPNTLYLTLA